MLEELHLGNIAEASNIGLKLVFAGVLVEMAILGFLAHNGRRPTLWPLLSWELTTIAREQ